MRPQLVTMAKIVVIYLIFGCLWVLTTDRLLLFLINDPEQLSDFQTYKGWFFVGLSGMVIFVLLRREKRTLGQTQDSLGDREAQISRLFYASPEPMWVYDLETLKFLAVNDAAIRAYGYSLDEFLGMTIKDIRPAVEVPRLLSQLKRPRTGVQDAGTWKHRSKNGSVFDVEVSSSDLVFGGNQARLVLARDLTERLASRRRILQLSRLYATLSHINKTIVRVKSVEELYQDVCRVAVDSGELELAWIGLLNKETGDVRQVATSDQSKAVFADINIHQEPYAHGLTARAIRDITIVTSPDLPIDPRMEHRRKLAMERELRSTAVLAFTANDTIGALHLYSSQPGFFDHEDEYALLSEIRDDVAFAIERLANEKRRREAETKLRDSEAKFRLAIQHSPIIVFTQDRDLRYTWVENPSAEIPKEIIGSTDDDIYGVTSAEVLTKLKRAVLSDGLTLRREVEVRIANEAYFYDIYVEPIRDGHDQIIGLAGVSIDVTERRKSDANIRRLQMAVENSGDIIFMTDLHGTITYVNPTFTNTYGYEEAEVAGKTTPRLLKSGETDAAIYRELWYQLAAGNSFSMNVTNKTKDGRLLQIETSLNPILDQYGAVTGYLAIQRDITERQRLHKLLNEKQRLLSETEQLAGIGGFTYIPETGDFSYSDEFQVIAGMEMGALKPAELLNLIEPADRKKVAELAQHVMKGIDIREIDFRIRKPGGLLRHVRGRAKLISENGGKASRIVGTVQDITQHRWAEEALRASEQKYREMIHWASVGIYQSTPDGIITLANECLAAILGYDDSAALLGRSLADEIYYDPAERNRLIEAYIDLGHTTNMGTEILWKKKDGQPIWVSLAAHAIKSDDEALLYFEGFVSDISSKKKAEAESQALQEQLAQAQKLESLGTLAGGVAHDFNNILGIILGYSGFLRKNLANPEKTKEGFDAINEAVLRGTGVVRQLLTFARKTDLNTEPLSLNEEIRDFHRLIGATLPKTVIFKLELSESDPIVRADRTQIHQVLLNLAINSKDAMGGNGTITIRTEAVDGRTLRHRNPGALSNAYAHIALSDTGTGMSADVLDRIFEPFFTTKEKGKGTGLGLPVTFGIVKSHNGFIHVESVVNEGSAFHIYLPADAEITGPAADQDSNLLFHGGNEAILIIEDEARLRKLLDMILHDMGYKIFSAAEGKTGLAVFENNRETISVVITDLDMPGMNGLEVAEKIHAMAPEIILIFSSGYIDSATREKAEQFGVKAVIQKPYDTDEIARTIRELLNSA